jgi:protein-L-isoaspartate(D-aspartate) O-methyltransferase
MIKRMIKMDWELLRHQMVSYQIKNRGIQNKAILEALKRIPRHLFVPPEIRDESYCDHPLPIGLNQTISQPYIVALMTNELEVQPHHKILEIGTGCGYQTAILAELVAEVYSVEIIPDLFELAQKNLDRLKFQNIHLKNADGLSGWEDAAPFDGIIITAAPADIPTPLLQQLKPEGLMIVPVGTFFQSLYKIKKASSGQIQKKTITQVRFVPMTGKAEKIYNYQLS